jgi:hypothetical protein
MAFNAIEPLKAMGKSLDLGKGDNGHSVRLLRRALAQGGFGNPDWARPTAQVSDRFDEPLRLILVNAQRDLGVTPDGIFGPITLAALERHINRGQTITPTGTEQELRRAFVRKAESYVGVREKPGKKRNRGEPIETFIRHCGFDPEGSGNAGVAWCGCLLRYCLDKAAESLGRKAPFTISAYVPSIVAVARKQGRIIPPHQVREGDLWIWNTGGRYRHVEVCTGPVVNGMVPTIGGNTGDGSINAGDGCYRRLRPAKGNLFIDVCASK